MHIAQKIMEGSKKVDPELCEAVYRCLLCQACKVGCPLTIDTYLVIRDLREAMVRKGLGPMTAHRDLLTAMSTCGHPSGHLDGKRGQWIHDLQVKDALHEHCEVLLYVGCNVTQSPSAKRSLDAAVSVLRGAGLDIGALGENEHCCGAFAAELGDRALFLKLAKANMACLNKAAPKEIITTCPFCYAFLKTEYQEDADLSERLECKVTHITEVLSRLLTQGSLRTERVIKKKVTYHDPCHLGRHAAVYDAPRMLLKGIPGIELMEMMRNKQNAYCCGGGTGIHEAFREFSQTTALERLKEAQETGADYLVTACPHCYVQFQRGISSMKTPPPLRVVDLLELVEQSATVA